MSHFMKLLQQSTPDDRVHLITGRKKRLTKMKVEKGVVGFDT